MTSIKVVERVKLALGFKPTVYVLPPIKKKVRRQKRIYV